MNIEIQYVKNAGELKNERLVLKVLKSCDIGRHLLFDTTYNEDSSVSNSVRHPYWFPDKAVRAGDLVVVYTKSGIDTSKINKDKSHTHFFYRGIERTIWNKDEDCAVLFEISDWDTKHLKRMKPK